MELSVKVVTRPWPASRVRLVVLVILIVAVVAFRAGGCAPGMAVSLALGAGLGAARVARALAGDPAPARLPGPSS
jgi:hypothetical protein